MLTSTNLFFKALDVMSIFSWYFEMLSLTNKKKSYFEIVYSVVAKIDEEVKEKKDLEKIILCDIPTKICPDLENTFLNLIHNSGHPSIKIEKKVDFKKLYNERFN